LDQKLRYFRALDFIPGNTKSELLVNMINKEFKQDQNAQLLAIRHMAPTYIQTNAAARKTLIGLLPKTSEIEYLELVEKYELAEENPKLLSMILAGKQARKAGQVLYKLAGGAELLAKTARNGNEKIQRAVIESIRWQGKQESLALLFDIMTNSAYPLAVQREAARSIGNSSAGEDYALAILKNKKVPAPFIPGVVESVSRTWRKAIRMEANSYLGATAQGSKTKHPPLNELVTLKGNAKEGIKSFINQCSMCHQIDQNGIDFGPKLSEIGSKLSKDGLYLSILHPNAGIGFGYETYEIKTKSGDTYQGIVMSKTETDVILKLPGGTVQNFKTSGLSSVKQLPESLMPEGLADQMSTVELSNLIEYLTTLKKK
jgi:putative heme-binding domain-containing protein